MNVRLALVCLVLSWVFVPAAASPRFASPECLSAGGSLGADDEGGEQAEGKDALWELDEDGLRQWKEVDEDCSVCGGSGEAECRRCKDGGRDACGECDLSGEATCRDCGGDGKRYDPLEEMVCPYCDGSAFWTCSMCGGAGNYQVTGGSRDGQRCGPCKTTGVQDCGVCRGKRRVPVVKVPGGGPGKAKAKSLDKAREDLVDVMHQMEGLAPRGLESDDRQAFDRALKGASKLLPFYKSLKSMVEADMKFMRGGQLYVGYEKRVRKEFQRIQDRTVRMLKGQIALLDLCKERLAFNEKVKSR